MVGRSRGLQTLGSNQVAARIVNQLVLQDPAWPICLCHQWLVLPYRAGTTGCDRDLETEKPKLLSGLLFSFYWAFNPRLYTELHPTALLFHSEEVSLNC